jgi:hypothetical protein
LTAPSRPAWQILACIGANTHKPANKRYGGKHMQRGGHGGGHGPFVNGWHLAVAVQLISPKGVPIDK